MEARPLPIQRSGARQLNNLGASGAMSSSLSVLPTSLEESYPKLPPQQTSLQREVRARPVGNATFVPSNAGVVGHIFSSSSGFSSDLQYSSVSTHNKHARSAPFISQSSTNATTLPISQSSESSMPHSTASSHYNRESNSSWCPESLPAFIDFPTNASLPNSQLESSSCSGVMSAEDFGKKNDWQDWADQLITDDDGLATDWNELLSDNNMTELEPKV